MYIDVYILFLTATSVKRAKSQNNVMMSILDFAAIDVIGACSIKRTAVFWV